MKHEFELWRPGKDQPDGRITWDSDAGTLSGDLAEELEKLIDQAIADGVLVSHPMPTSYRITRPLHDAAQLGAIISLRWRTPELLADAMMRQGGDFVVKSSVELIY